MKYIEGKTLAEIIEEGALPQKTAKSYMLQLIEAVNVLHSHGFVHRDIKPENIIITKDGTLKLIDFDASLKLVRGKKRDTECIGTKGFAAPEQYGFLQSDERSDIYAMGLVYNYLLTGKHPQDEEAQGDPGKIIKKCTRIEKERRYKTVKRLKIDIESEKFSAYGIFDYIVGFRSRNPIKMAIAMFVYLLLTVSYVDTFRYFSEDSTVVETMIIFVYIMSYTLVFYLIVFNIGNFCGHIPAKIKPMWLKQLVFAVFWYLAGSMFFVVVADAGLLESLLYNPLLLAPSGLYEMISGLFF